MDPKDKIRLGKALRFAKMALQAFDGTQNLDRNALRAYQKLGEVVFLLEDDGEPVPHGCLHVPENPIK